MNGFVVFLIILLIAIPLAYGGWVFYSRMQARKLGLPPPSLIPFTRDSSATQSNYPGPAPAGIKGWINAQIYKFKNRNNRSAAGSYEPSAGGYGGDATRGRGAGSRLDPDEAWDSRVGNVYYEEQELGLHEPVGGRNGGGASANPFESSPYGGGEHERGRSRTREYAELDDGRGHLQNPFGDDNATSLRGVSPRPLDHGVDTSYGGAAESGVGATPVVQKKPKKAGSLDGDSLHDGRRSLFREDI